MMNVFRREISYHRILILAFVRTYVQWAYVHGDFHSDHGAERSGEEVKGPAGLMGSASPSRRGGMPFAFFCFFVRSKASVRFPHVALDS